MKRNFVLIVYLIGLSLAGNAAELKQTTTTAFDKYVAVTEARINNELRTGGTFLYVDGQAEDARQSSYNQLRKGEVLVEQRQTRSPGLSLDVPDGMVHHWVGIIFIPGITLAELLPVMRDYDRRAELYKPDVIASHLISHQGDDYAFFLRLYQKRFTTVVFNTEYVAHWGQVDPHKTYSHSRSTTITEVKDPDRPAGDEWPVGPVRRLEAGPGAVLADDDVARLPAQLDDGFDAEDVHVVRARVGRELEVVDPHVLPDRTRHREEVAALHFVAHGDVELRHVELKALTRGGRIEQHVVGAAAAPGDQRRPHQNHRRPHHESSPL